MKVRWGQLEFLEKAVKSQGVKLKPQLLGGFREGCNSDIAKRRKKREELTVEKLLGEVTSNLKFIRILGEADIKVEDLKKIIEEELNSGSIVSDVR